MVLFAHFHMALGLRALRIRQGVSASDLCKAAGLPQGDVNRIERGQFILDYLTAARLTNALAVGLAEIAVSAHQIDFARVKHEFDLLIEAEASKPTD